MDLEELEQNNYAELERKFEKLYLKGYRSHSFAVDVSNEYLIRLISNDSFEENASSRKTMSFDIDEDQDDDYYDEDDDDEFIPDLILSLLINKNNEIVVNDTLYKFTKQDGLFLAQIKDSLDLLQYFDGNKLILEEFNHQEGLTNINNTGTVLGFIPPQNNFNNQNKIVSSISPILAMSADDEKRQIINSLPECRGKRRNVIKNLFGKTWECREKFDSKNRVKVEFWDQNWYFYKSVGVSVKTQKKKAKIWWKSKSDEVELGINRVYLKYYFVMPEVFASTSQGNIGADPIFAHKNKFYTSTNSNWYNPQYSIIDLNTNGGSLPFFKFENNNILNIYFLGDNYNLTTEDILSESNIKKLYEMGIKFLGSAMNNTSNKNEFAVTYQKGYNNIEVVYFSERYNKKNSNKINKIFYGDISVIVSASKGNGDWKFNVKPMGFHFRKYTDYDIDVYGMALRKGQWKGVRMVRNERK